MVNKYFIERCSMFYKNRQQRHNKTEKINVTFGKKHENLKYLKISFRYLTSTKKNSTTFLTIEK